MTAFSTKDLLICMAVIATGSAALGLVLHTPPPSMPMGFRGSFALFVGAGAIIGAGLFRLAKRPWTGALIGALVQIAIVAYLVSASH